MPATMPSITFRYLDLSTFGPMGGRGNAVRLTMLVHGIPFTEELVSLADWGAGEKERTAKEGINPGGYLPAMKFGDESKWCGEHIALCRRIARIAGLYGANADLDWETDAVCDVYQGWRNAWAKTLGKGEDADEVKSYLSTTRAQSMKVLEAMYADRSSTDSPFLVDGDVPGFGDLAVYNLARDDSITFPEAGMSAAPNLSAMVAACQSNPEVAKWAKAADAKAAAAKA